MLHFAKLEIAINNHANQRAAQALNFVLGLLPATTFAVEKSRRSETRSAKFVAARVERSPGTVRQMSASTAKVVEIPNTDTTDETKPGRGAAKLRKAADEILTRDSKALA